MNRKKTISIIPILIVGLLWAFNTGCDNDEFPDPKDISIADNLTLELLGADSLFSDGVSRCTLRAHLNPDADDSFKTLKFRHEVTGGASFISTAEDPVDVIKAGPDGIADAILQVGTTSGQFLVSVEVEKKPEIKVTKQLTIGALSAGDILSISFDEAEVYRADGEKVVPISLMVSNTPSESISVATTGGAFVGIESGATIPLSLGTAEVELKVSNSPGDYRVTASIANPAIAVWKNVTVLPAFPDSMIVELDQPGIDTTNPNVSLNILLTRDEGTVSNGIPVSFRNFIEDPVGNEVTWGWFTGAQNAVSANGQVAGVVFVSDSVPVPGPGPVHIEITTEKDDGSFLTKEVMVPIN